MMASHLHRTHRYHQRLYKVSDINRSILLRNLSSLIPPVNHDTKQPNAPSTTTHNTDLNPPRENDPTPKSKFKNSYVGAISELSKAKLSALVVSTSSFGFLAAATTPTCYTTLAAASIGTALCSSCASCLNQIIEQDRDAKMKRTANRPLVTKSVIGTPGALALACTTGLSGGATLYYGTDVVTTALGVGNIALYAGAYTYLKPRSEWNTWVGAVVGAIPPVMGYTAATQGQGLLDIEAALLGATLFLWQFPHFMALSWMHRVDYARGGFEMVATNDSSRGDETARLIMAYTYYLSAMPVISTLSGATSSMFAIEGLALNGYAIYVARKFNEERSNGNARKVFLTSLWYLPCWMMLFLLHSTKWKEDVIDDENTQINDDVISYLKGRFSNIRNKGKELCVHEIVHDDAANSVQCPIIFGKAQAHHVGSTIEDVVGTATTKMEGDLETP